MAGGAVEAVELAAVRRDRRGAMSTSGDVGTAAERPGVVDEGADLGLVVTDRTAARLHVGVGERHAAGAEDEVDRRPTLR